MIFYRKYSEEASIHGIPLITKDAVDFKVTPTLAVGDAMISIDGGAFANLTNLPTVLAGSTGVTVSLTAAEMVGKIIAIRFIDQTSPKEWEDQEILIESYGDANAQHVHWFDNITVTDKTGYYLAADQSAVTIGKVTSVDATELASTVNYVNTVDTVSNVMNVDSLVVQAIWNALLAQLTLDGSSIGAKLNTWLPGRVKSYDTGLSPAEAINMAQLEANLTEVLTRVTTERMGGLDEVLNLIKAELGDPPILTEQLVMNRTGDNTCQLYWNVLPDTLGYLRMQVNWGDGKVETFDNVPLELNHTYEWDTTYVRGFKISVMLWNALNETTTKDFIFFRLPAKSV